MDKISEKDKTIIREYWATYYKKNEELEVLHSQRKKQMDSLEEFEEEEKELGFDRSAFYFYCDKMSKLYRDYATADKTIVCQIERIKEELGEAEENYNIALEIYGLELECRTYEEDLYNLVNGLEEEEYKKLQKYCSFRNLFLHQKS